MASSPAEPTRADAVFALQEVIACWDQGYEALARGDLERLEALLDVAEAFVPRLPASDGGDPAVAQMRAEAAASRGRLEHGMHSGLDALRGELGRARTGAKVLRGYAQPDGQLGNRVESRV
jgi:hypothetical protein